MAHSLGFYAARTYVRLQKITHTAHHEGSDRLNQPLASQSTRASEQESAQTPEQAEDQHQPATRKAEEMVDSLAQSLSSLTASARLNLQRTAARVREDTEDVWAEAQNIRHHQRASLPQ